MCFCTKASVAVLFILMSAAVTRADDLSKPSVGFKTFGHKDMNKMPETHRLPFRVNRDAKNYDITRDGSVREAGVLALLWPVGQGLIHGLSTQDAALACCVCNHDCRHCCIPNFGRAFSSCLNFHRKLGNSQNYCSEYDNHLGWALARAGTIWNNRTRGSSKNVLWCRSSQCNYFGLGGCRHFCRNDLRDASVVGVYLSGSPEDADHTNSSSTNNNAASHPPRRQALLTHSSETTQKSQRRGKTPSQAFAEPH